MVGTKMYRIGLLALMVAFSAFLSGQALAGLTNGSFETGDLTGWTAAKTGGSGYSASVVSSHTSATGSPPMSWSPTDGSWFALLKPPTGNQEMELYQSFTAPAAGDKLGFDFFWDGETANLSNGEINSARARILTGSGTGGTPVGSDLFAFDTTKADTAWASFSKSMSALGLTQGSAYTLLFEIINNKGNGNDSYLGIDNVALVPDPPVSPVPLPAGVLLGMLGLSVAGVKLRRSV
jgi:hypothetical protein